METAKRPATLQAAQRSAEGRWAQRGWLLGVALVATLLNAWKPMHIDDPAYYAFAKQIAQHPLDPYGFMLFWWQQPQPANEILAPPVVPYWWAAGVRLFGEQPVLWKLWLLPLLWILVAALDALVARFAAGLERPLTLLIVLSPAVLPGINLMLDVPALALSLGALALFFDAVDKRSWRQALAAGLVAGLALQTKYTSAVSVAALLVYALLARQWRLGVAAVGVSAVVFVGWEGFTAWKYGQSHFLTNFHQRHTVTLNPLMLAFTLLTIPGGLIPTAMLLGLIALQRSRRVVLAGVVVIVIAFVLIAALPDPLPSLVSVLGPAGLGNLATRSAWIDAALGVALWLMIGLVVRQWSAARPEKARRAGADAVRWQMGFLMCWLGLEVAGYLVLSPFPAARRVMGLVVVMVLIAGHEIARTGVTEDRRRMVYGVTALTMLLGSLYFLVDVREATAEQEAGPEAARLIRAEEPRARIWFVGHWGFQYYAERAGMQSVIPAGPGAGGEGGMASEMHKGDWLVVPTIVEHQKVALHREDMRYITELSLDDFLPLRTVPGYYLGVTPMQHRHGARLQVLVYRVTHDLAASGPGTRE